MLSTGFSALAEHLPLPFLPRAARSPDVRLISPHAACARISLLNGSNKPFLDLAMSHAIAEASSTKILRSFSLRLDQRSSGHRRPAEPNNFASWGMDRDRVGVHALGELGGSDFRALHHPAPSSTRRGGSSGRAALKVSHQIFFVLRRLARSGFSRPRPGRPRRSACGAPTLSRRAGCRARSTGSSCAARSASSDVSEKSRVRSRVAGAASRLRLSPHFDSSRSTSVPSTRSG